MSIDKLHEDYPIVPASEPSASVGEYDPFERIEEEVAKGVDGDDIWQDVISLGITIADADDDNHFKLGRLAASVGKKYGEDRIGIFADAIRKSKKPLQEWRQVWVFWGMEMITQFRAFPMVRYSHFRCAMRVGQKLDDPNAAYRFMMDAVENEWSVGKTEVEAAQRMGKTVGPIKLSEGTAEVVKVSGSNVTLKVANEAVLQAFAEQKLQAKTVLLRVYEDVLATPKTGDGDAGAKPD